MKHLIKSKINYLLMVFIFMIISCESLSKSHSSKTEDSTSPSYTKEQIVFSLNWLANIMYGVDTSYDVLVKNAPLAINQVLENDSVIPKIGEWSVVWGPVIFSEESSNCKDHCVVDNLLVLYENNSSGENGAPDYVLTTSGTNDISRYGWFKEDLDVYNLVVWPDLTQAATFIDFYSIIKKGDVTKTTIEPAVSQGTAKGLSVLLGMSDDGVELIEGLKKYVGGSANTLAVAGHSLGGALSPTLALVLKQYQSEWDSSSEVTIEVHPTAGASPGNSPFYDYFFEHFQNNFYGKMNTMDIVPHAWQKDMLEEIESLYEPHVNKTELIGQLITNIICKLDTLDPKCPYQSLYYDGKEIPDDRRFTMDYNPNVDSSRIAKLCKIKNIPLLCNNTAFFAQAKYQHTGAYVEEYQVEFMESTINNVMDSLKLDSTNTVATDAILLLDLVYYINELKSCR